MITKMCNFASKKAKILQRLGASPLDPDSDQRRNLRFEAGGELAERDPLCHLSSVDAYQNKVVWCRNCGF